MTFTPDHPGAIVVQADVTNYYLPENHGSVANQPKGWVLHTPEEAADDNPVTPYYFQIPSLGASTHYFVATHGAIYQMVPERCAAIANGVVGKPYPVWANPNSSLNWQTLNVEIEGFASSIQDTLLVGGMQFNALLNLIKERAGTYGIPLDREHIIGHYEVSVERTDPGALFPWDALISALSQEGSEMIRLNGISAWYEDPAHQQWAGMRGVNAINDFTGLPVDAKAVQIEVYLQSGSAPVAVRDGNETAAGPHAFTVNDYFQGQVFLDRGWFHLAGGNESNPVKIKRIGIVGYYR